MSFRGDPDDPNHPIDPIFYKPPPVDFDGTLNGQQKAEIKPVVDWKPLVPGDARAHQISSDHGLLAHATYVNKKTSPASPTKEKAVKKATGCASRRAATKTRDIAVFDRAAARLNEQGWATSFSLAGQEAQPYELFDTTEADIGVFGGPGMRLYFYVLRNLFYIFLIMAMFAIPAMVSFGSGEVYEESHLSPLGKLLARGTLGNMDDLETDVEGGASGKLWLASIMSCTSSAILLWFTFRLNHWMKEIVAESDHQAISMNDYTVMVVPNFKKNKHRKLELDGELTLHGGWTEYASRKLVTDTDSSGNETELPDASIMGGQKDAEFKKDLKEAIEKTVGGAVVAPNPSDLTEPAIWSAWNEEANIELWIQKYELLSKLETGLSIASQGDEKRMEAALKGLEKCNQKLATLNLEDDSKPWQPVAAFVTFESPSLRKLAIKRKTVTVGETECDIVEAPEPESVQYQHLQYTKRSRRLRRLLMLFCTWTLILLGAAGIIKVQTMVGDMAYLNDCKLIYGPNTDSTYAASSAVCETSDPTKLIDMQQSYRRLILEANAFKADKNDLTGVYIPGDIQWNYENHSKSLVDASCHACICNSFTSKWNNVTSNGHGSLTKDYCEQFNHDKRVDTVKGLMATAAVVAMNQFLKQFIKKTGFFLKTHTIEEDMQSKASRVFAAQVINTAILTMLLSFNLPVVENIKAVDHYDQANHAWFAQIGAPMVKTMVIQFFVPWIMHGIFQKLTHLNIYLGNRNFMKMGQTQNALNKCNEPNSWDIAAGYGEVLMAMSVTLMYGPGVPLLYFVAAIGFGIRYWMDKWAATRVFKKPPLYGPELMEGFDMILAIFAVVHTFASCYYFSVAGIKGSDVKVHVENNLHVDLDPFRPHGIPLFLVFVLALVNLLYKIGIRTFPSLKELLQERRKRIMKKTKQTVGEVANRTISLATDGIDAVGNLAEKGVNILKDGDASKAGTTVEGEPAIAVTVWVGGIPKECIIEAVDDHDAKLVDDLASQANSFGEVKSFTVRVKEGDCKSWALITFDTPSACKACVEKGLTYDSDGESKQLKITLADVEGQKSAGAGTGALSRLAAVHSGDFSSEIMPQDLEIFSGLPSRFKEKVHSELKRVSMSKGDVVMSAGESDGKLYVVTAGVVEIIESLDDDAQIIALVEDHDCFGEELWAAHEHGSEHFWEDSKRTVYARCRTDVTLFTVEKSDLYPIATEFDKQKSVSAKSFVKTIEAVILERNQCPPFTEAVKGSHIANEEEDYLSDEFETLLDLREAMVKVLEPFQTYPPTADMTKNLAPFNTESGKHLFQRILNAIHVPVRSIDAEAALQKVPMFANLSAGHLSEVAKGMTLEEFVKGDTVIKKGDEGHSFFLINSGKVAFSLVDDVSWPLAEDQIIGTRGTAAYFGEVSLIKGGACTATAIVASDTLSVYVLSKENFQTHLKEVRAQIIENLPEDQRSAASSFHMPTLPHRP